jgi:hypothetical protein
MMHPESRILLTLCGALCVALFSGTLGAEERKPAVPTGWKFTFPDGDRAAGKLLFFDRLACDSCHNRPTAGVTRKPGYGGIGPDLVGYSALPKEYLAEAIIRAHKVVAAPGYVVREGGPAMGNYNHLLLVQELVDLVAFLRAPETKKQ